MDEPLCLRRVALGIADISSLTIADSSLEPGVIVKISVVGWVLRNRKETPLECPALQKMVEQIFGVNSR